MKITGIRKDLSQFRKICFVTEPAMTDEILSELKNDARGWNLDPASFSVHEGLLVQDDPSGDPGHIRFLNQCLEMCTNNVKNAKKAAEDRRVNYINGLSANWDLPVVD